MNTITDNAELVVFGASVIPALILVFRFLLKLQLSGEEVYERRAHNQAETIEHQDTLIHQLRQLREDCEERDRKAKERIDELEKEVLNLQEQVVQLQLRNM